MKKLSAVLLCVAMLAMSGAALADDSTISVQGSGTVFVESDLATISLGVREVARDVLEAQAAVNAKIDAVRGALIDAGVKENEINTDSIGIYANYDYSGTAEAIVGYTAYNSLSVRSGDIDNIGKIIDAAFAAGANSLDYVQFSVKDSTSAQDEALKMAFDDAVRKADTLAAAANLKIGGIDSIREEYNYSYDSMRNYKYAPAEDGVGGGTMVQAALVSVTAAVTVEFDAD